MQKYASYKKELQEIDNELKTAGKLPTREELLEVERKEKKQVVRKFTIHLQQPKL